MDQSNEVVPGDESVEELDDWVTRLGGCSSQASDNVRGYPNMAHEGSLPRGPGEF